MGFQDGNQIEVTTAQAVERNGNRTAIDDGTTIFSEPMNIDEQGGRRRRCCAASHRREGCGGNCGQSLTQAANSLPEGSMK